MPAIAVSILGVAAIEGFPEMVECELIDRFGKSCRFIEKLPVVEVSSSHNNRFPRPGAIACEVIETCHDDQGRAYLLVDTQRPWGVQSVDEVSRFAVFAELVTD